MLAYAENRLRLNPVPLDEGSRDPATLDSALQGLPGGIERADSFIVDPHKWLFPRYADGR